MTKHKEQIFEVSSFSSYKTTLKQHLNGEKLDVRYLSGFGWAFLLCCAGVRRLEEYIERGLRKNEDEWTGGKGGCHFWWHSCQIAQQNSDPNFFLCVCISQTQHRETDMDTKCDSLNHSLFFRERERERERERDTETERHRERQTDRQIDRDGEWQRQTDRNRDRNRHRHRNSIMDIVHRTTSKPTLSNI